MPDFNNFNRMVEVLQGKPGSSFLSAETLSPSLKIHANFNGGCATLCLAGILKLIPTYTEEALTDDPWTALAIPNAAMSIMIALNNMGWPTNQDTMVWISEQVGHISDQRWGLLPGFLKELSAKDPIGDFFLEDPKVKENDELFIPISGKEIDVVVNAHGIQLQEAQAGSTQQLQDNPTENDFNIDDLRIAGNLTVALLYLFDRIEEEGITVSPVEKAMTEGAYDELDDMIDSYDAIKAAVEYE